MSAGPSTLQGRLDRDDGGVPPPRCGPAVAVTVLPAGESVRPRLGGRVADGRRASADAVQTAQETRSAFAEALPGYDADQPSYGAHALHLDQPENDVAVALAGPRMAGQRTAAWMWLR